MKKLIISASLALTLRFAVAGDAADPAAAGFSGKVLETTNTAGYTYVLVDTGSQKHWAVANAFEVKTGDTVTVAAGMPMPKYYSKTLKKTFDVVYFTSGITVGGATPAGGAPALPPGHPALPGAENGKLPAGHPPLTTGSASAGVELKNIPRAPGGSTVAEIIAGKQSLAGKSVAVRGRVVKYNADIMGKNWLHIRDGSGTAGKGDNDLTVTTQTETKVGATVLVTGVVVTDKDFGAGYKYSVMIEDAKVTVE